MKYYLIFILTIAAPNIFAENEFIVVSGYGLENSYMESPKVCAEGAVCMRSWFKYKIKVEKTIKGEKVGSEVTAVRNQHAEYIMDKNELAVFILSKIKSKAEQEKFKAQYIVHEFSRPKSIYCFDHKLKKYDLSTDDEIKNHPSGMWEKTCINKSELLSE